MARKITAAAPRRTRQASGTTHTVTLNVEGIDYTWRLTGPQFASLRDCLAEAGEPTEAHPTDFGLVRTWATSHDWVDVGDRGRLPSQMKEEFLADNRIF